MMHIKLFISVAVCLCLLHMYVSARCISVLYVCALVCMHLSLFDRSRSAVAHVIHSCSSDKVNEGRRGHGLNPFATVSRAKQLSR